MTDIDLVPQDYRHRLQARAWLRVFLVAVAILAAGAGTARATLSYGIRARTLEIERLRHDKNSALHLKLTLDELRERHGKLASRVGILARLRQGAAATRVFHLLDRALDERVWLQDWRFTRAGEVGPVPPRSEAAGYLLVLPAGQSDEGDRAWRLRTHMDLRGQAMDHSALADFVARLNAAPEVEEAKVLNTRIREYTHLRVVDFELGVVMQPGEAAG